MRRRRMNGVDAAWLRMETPDNLMMVTGLFFFGHPVAYAPMRSLVAQALLRYRRFRERVEEPSFGRPEWVEVDGAKFTKPAHIQPRPGYDAMYGGPNNSLRVIPAGERRVSSSSSCSVCRLCAPSMICSDRHVRRPNRRRSTSFASPVDRKVHDLDDEPLCGPSFPSSNWRRKSFRRLRSNSG